MSHSRPGNRRQRAPLTLLGAIVLAEALVRLVSPHAHPAIAAARIAVELVAAAGLLGAGLAARPSRSSSLGACVLAIADALVYAAAVYVCHVRRASAGGGALLATGVRLSIVALSIAVLAWQLGRIRRWP